MSKPIHGPIRPNVNPLAINRHSHIRNAAKWQLKDALALKNGPHATVYMINGDQYLGEWKGNLKHGNGTYFYRKNGSVYEGEWQNDMRHGYGTFSVPKEPSDDISEPTAQLRKVYAGEWQNDKRHGFGTHYYEDGSHYEGHWENNMKEGWGKMFYIDGSVYEGEWHEEKRQGQGILLLANGDRYEGMWMDDLKEGPGKYIYKQKRQSYHGEWVKGLPKCGTLIDLPPLPGQRPKKFPIPHIKLVDPDRILSDEREAILEDRWQRMMDMAEGHELESEGELDDE
ncbi:uncharacterized protein BJ171DRAFT_631830 [Polychytrium aggregatum]|uniref:uncharacterized protein n=1 Tax=Polychytrium aggregatum TaxID=110093 RepID=UPI0022FDC415|nr:uncharacterized protein BJ171DRAFT_631830 [Polychytrium aggregatum]KAI9199341.1 hypothetical protein BJ171DRAFT_631830 [Polychytrium aggregatum]